MVNYNDYMNSINSIGFEEATQIYEQMISQMDMNDTDDAEFWNELIENIKDYVVYRVNWMLWDRETRLEKARARSMCHDSVITSFDALARIQGKAGKDNSWREKLGNDRKRIGDFASYIMYIVAINMR